jgi:hypothetical protein
MSSLSPRSPLSPLASPRINASHDQMVVTYLDSNYLWKDYVVLPKDIVHRQISVTDQEISCVVPDFWSHISPTAHIKHVRYTVNGQTFHLPWPPAAQDSLASPALTLQVLLHEGLDKALTYVRWQELSQQLS